MCVRDRLLPIVCQSGLGTSLDSFCLNRFCFVFISRSAICFYIYNCYILLCITVMASDAKNELQRNAIADARRKELETYQRALDIQWMNNRMDDGGMGRCLALIQREAEMEKEFQERTDHAAIVNSKAQKEIALGLEIAKVRREEACTLLRRHYLRERDPSLRELIKKLQAGYVCRDQQQQILHNEYRRLQEKVEENHANAMLQNALYDNLQEQEREEKEKLARTCRYCLDLQQQLVNRQRQRQCQYEDTLIEKKTLDDIIKTMYDEDMRELKHKREQMEKMRQEMVTSQQARLAWRQKQKELVVIEERKIAEQIKACSDRSAAIVAERERKLREKEELNAKITAKILADEAERQERENIIKSLQEQELLEKNANDDMAEKEKLERVKKETKDALFSQMDIRKKLNRENKEREESYRKDVEAKLHALDEKEREKERLKHEKRQQYAAELKRQMAENEVRRKQEKQLEEGRARHVWDCHRAWQNEVSEERKKIIEEHVPNLVGYLQAGVIKQEDLPVVQAGVAKRPELRPLHLDSSAANRPKRHPKCNPQCVVLREY